MVTNFSGDFVALVTVINEPVPCLSRPKISAHPEAFPAVWEQGTRPIGDPTKYHMHRTFSAALTLALMSGLHASEHPTSYDFGSCLGLVHAIMAMLRDETGEKRNESTARELGKNQPLHCLPSIEITMLVTGSYHSATSHIKRS
jgi:hypothetical protein